MMILEENPGIKKRKRKNDLESVLHSLINTVELELDLKGGLTIIQYYLDALIEDYYQKFKKGKISEKKYNEYLEDCHKLFDEIENMKLN